MSDRTCGYCGRSLTHLRADAKWCSDAHRKAAKRAQRPDKARTRRPSRNGRGVRVYIAPGEVRPNGGIAPSLLRKIRAAYERLERKETH